MFTPHLSLSLPSSESLTQGYMSFYRIFMALKCIYHDHQNRSGHNHQVAGRSSWSAAWRVDQNPHRPSECRRWWPPPQRHRCRWSTRTHQRYLRKTRWKLESRLQVPPEKNAASNSYNTFCCFFWVSWRCHHGINNKLVIWKTIPHYPIQNVWWGQNSVNCPSKFSKETMAPPPRSYTKMFFSVFLSKPHLLFAWKVVEFPENHVVVLVLGRDLQFDSSLLKLMLQYSTIPHSQYHQLHWEVFLLVCIPAYACRF